MVMRQEINVDNFAGGGGVSEGARRAGLPIHIAINHDERALCMHKANHPHTRHIANDVWSVDPVEVTNGRPVGLAWFSPDCRHFSKAKGGRPVKKNIRDLAWVVIKWAAKVKPRVIMLENVEEFLQWGPIGPDGKPDRDMKGTTFTAWRVQLENLGYTVEYNFIRAKDQGTATSRKRFFVIARRDGEPIVWPKSTHGPGLEPYAQTADQIDWDTPTRSIIGRKRMLADNTLKRIVRGLHKFVIEDDNPYVMRVEDGTCLPFTTRICQSGRAGNPARSVRDSLSTIVSKNEHLLVQPYVVKLRNNCTGQSIREPLDTITSGGNHFYLAMPYFIKYYGTATGQRVNEPLHTITTKHRFSLVELNASPAELTEDQRYNAWWVARLLEDYGTEPPAMRYPTARASAVAIGDYILFDIRMRMLTPRELFRCSGFDDDYIIDPVYKGKPLTQTEQVRMCGNAVPPDLPEALIRANMTGYGEVGMQGAI